MAAQQTKDEWLNERRSGIGGSDAPAILGLSPFRSAHDVWLDKRGEAPARPPTEAMWWGTEMESLIARRFEERTGLLVVNPQRIFRHPDYAFLIGTPDRFIADASGPLTGLEIKTANAFADGWGDEGSDEIPAHYLVQVHHYLTVTGAEMWYVAALIGGSDFRLYRVPRDTALSDEMTARLVDWWQRHIVEGEEPAITGRASDTEWLRARFPRDSGRTLVADQQAIDWASALAGALQTQDAVNQVVEEAKNNLRLIMGDASLMTGPGFRVSYRKTKDVERVDWQKAATIALARLSRETAEAIRAECAETREGVRRFVFTPTGKGK